MRFTPKTEKEVAEEGLLPKGDYSFEIVEALNKISKSSGNDMIQLKLHVFDENGEARIIFDYLLESMARKLRHAATACGLLEQYDSGNLDAIDFQGKTGQVKIGIQKDKAGQYPDKNVVLDYVGGDRSLSPGEAVKAAMTAHELDDTIPF